jgi:hypothetical protein
LGFDVWNGFFGRPLFVYADIFGFGFDLVFAFVTGFFLIVLFFIFEIIAIPGIFAKRGLVYGFGIDDHAGFDDGFEIDSSQIGRCGLQGIEEQAGGFGIDLSA